MTNQEFIESISLEGEIWKDVIGYEGLYMVSSFARIVILSKEIVYTDGEDRRPNLLKGHSSVKSEAHESLVRG